MEEGSFGPRKGAKSFCPAPLMSRAPIGALRAGATDERNFVKKGVSWALRMVGLQSPGLRQACTAAAKRLTESDSASARWVGKEALREFAKR